MAPGTYEGVDDGGGRDGWDVDAGGDDGGDADVGVGGRSCGGVDDGDGRDGWHVGVGVDDGGGADVGVGVGGRCCSSGKSRPSGCCGFDRPPIHRQIPILAATPTATRTTIPNTLHRKEHRRG